MKMEIVEITPAMAEKWLAMNTNNRKLRRQYVTKIKNDILLNKWIMTGDPIRFSDKRLIDGQHRLMAIKESGVAVSSVVMWNVPDEAYDRIDQNKPRTSADILARHGEVNTTICSSVVMLLTAYEKCGSALHMQMYDRLTASDILEKMTDEIRESAVFASQNKIVGVLPPSVVGTAYLLCRRIDEHTADAFYRCVATGQSFVNLKTENAKLLRDRLLVHALSNKAMTIEHKFTWCVRAWNAERSRVELKTNGLKFTAGDPIPRFA